MVVNYNQFKDVNQTSKIIKQTGLNIMSKNTKKIANYVQEAKSKASDIFSKIRENAEEIKENASEWFKTHAKELKAAGIRTASVLLTTATLLSASMAMTGCENKPTQTTDSTTSSAIIEFPTETDENSETTTSNDPGDTEQQNIDELSAEDIVEKMESLIHKIATEKYSDFDIYNGLTQNDIDNMKIEFTSITPVLRQYIYGDDPLKFENPLTVYAPTTKDNEKGYTIAINYKITMKNTTVEDDINDLFVSKNVLDDVMLSLNRPSREITRDDASINRLDMLYSIGEYTYDGNPITKQDILTLNNKEQLKSIYNLLKNIINMNPEDTLGLDKE